MINKSKNMLFDTLKKCVNPFNNADTHWRMSVLCEYMLNKKSLPKISPKPKSQIKYLTLTGDAYRTMTRLSLWSLASKASLIPQLIIVHEDTSNANEIKSWLDFWPSEFQIYSQSEVANIYRDNGLEFHAKYIDSHIFGLKFLASLLFCQNNGLIYSDVDVLWFKDINELIDKYQYENGFTWLAHDYNHSYNSYLTEKFPDIFYYKFNEFPPGNAGFVWHKKSDFQQPWLESAIKATLSENPINEFSEQMILAHMSIANGGILDINDVCVNIHPKTKVSASFINQPWFARHYVRTIRRQFWIDAWHLI
jgi:hypothetical protein